MNPQIDRIHYVYILADTDDKPFYVGKGVGGYGAVVVVAHSVDEALELLEAYLCTS